MVSNRPIAIWYGANVFQAIKTTQTLPDIVVEALCILYGQFASWFDPFEFLIEPTGLAHA